MHIFHETLPTYEYDYTDNFDTQFRRLPEVVAYDIYFVDPQYGFDSYWDEELYDLDKLVYKETYNKPNDQIECDNLFTDAHVSDALRHALIGCGQSIHIYLIHQHHQTFSRDHKTNKGKQQSSTTKFYHNSR